MPQQSDAYDAMKWVLRRNLLAFSDAQTLRDILAVIKGIAIAWFPPHGSGFLSGFAEFVGRRFNAPVRSHYTILLEQFGHLPRREACDAVLSLLEEWRATEAVPAGEAGC